MREAAACEHDAMSRDHANLFAILFDDAAAHGARVHDQLADG